MGMLNKTKAAAEKAQKEFSEKLKSAYSNADNLKPDTADSATYDKLIFAVKEATEKNESIAAFEVRVKALGSGAVALAKTLGLLSVA